MEAILDFISANIFWIVIILLFVGPGVFLAPINRWIEARKAVRMKELEVREREAEARLLEGKRAEAERERTADMPTYLDPKDPADVAEWEAAKRETSQLAARAAASQRKQRQ